MFDRFLWTCTIVLSALVTTACSTLPDAPPREPSVAFQAGGQTSLGRLFEPEVRAHPDLSGIQLLNTGRDALQTRLALLELAEQAVDLQYYIWNSDYSGRLLAERVLRAADRGVRVRLLLDDFNVGDRDTPLVAMDEHPNVEVRIYNPNASRRGMARWFTFVGEFRRLNERMHNKMFVVDGSAAILGGRNVGDEYFGLSETLNFRDRELLAVGPVVPHISRGFDAYWNNERSYPIETIASDRPSHVEVQAIRARAASLEREHGPPDFPLPDGRASSLMELESRRSDRIWAEAQVVFDRARALDDDSGDERKRLAQVLHGIAEQAQSEVLIESAYFILSDEGLALLKELTESGVPVRALTNSLASNDVTANHAGYARRRKRTLKNGIELHELRPDAASCRDLIGSSLCDEGAVFGLHAKSMVFDRSTVFVGSLNLNLRSVYLNTEIGLIVHSPVLADQIAADIEKDMRPENSWRVVLDDDGGLSWTGLVDGKEVRYSHEPETSLGRRMKSGFISLLPIEKYL